MHHRFFTSTPRLTAALLIVAVLGWTTPGFAAETLRYTYDALGRVTSVTHVGGSNDGMVIGYTYDAAGNRTQYQVTGSRNTLSPPESVRYTYDAQGRVVTATYVGGANDGLVLGYTYDGAGNRTQYVISDPRNPPPPPPPPTTTPTTTLIVLPINGFTIIPITR